MSGEEAAFAALGLRPGAGRAEVNEAYRRLIKIHHPDRNGGDGRRAAEINRAYTLLSRNRDLGPLRPRSPPVPVRPPQRRPRRRPAIGLAILAAAGVAAAGFASGEGNAPLRTMTVPVALDAPVPARKTRTEPSADFDQPLETALINREIAQATGMYRAGDWQSAAEYSRDCRDKFRERPSLPLLDACTAFDEAILMLDRDATGESAGFSGSTIVIRELASTRAFGGDTTAADFRMQRIRSHVEMALLPVLDPAAAQQTAQPKL